ncbi:MAG: DUF5665 domain-containing protein [Marinibacterium sp.]|nr:DUF5665 domain-containing protein [Marinibacterium sp.]
MTDNSELKREIEALRQEIATFNGHRFIRVQNSWWLMILQALLRGMAVGLGTVVGASLLVSVLLYMLSQIDFLPIIGDWAAQIAQDIKASTGVDALGETSKGAAPADVAPTDTGPAD